MHVVFAIAAWVVFAWAWYVVFVKRVSDQTLSGVLALGVFLVVMLLLTLGWVRHNLRIYKRKGPRTTIPTVREDWTRDAMGRRIEASWQEVRSAPIVVIDASERVKRYRIETPARSEGG